ncbi:D-lyxose/D-mannose family sugar isomerase [Arsenicitalea aurantiaca]|uniref:D-lyxose ketol-isomerase n=1 Tax=Arsenicitalea aurantiaca TaxID=1783274 RepID=A0A433XA66_9HYPH|nr:D-lyxose/D-mannose family sugar isomerase [Arsenicitalea aurantiaca]RUT30969.1 D-lyxose/D-mannose family sugar isomerase [Arsenicitalea aurantiaca]
MGATTLKRSDVNEIIARGDAFIRSFGYILPPFAYWSPEDFRSRAGQIEGIRAGALGWDITDFGLGDFEKSGLFLFTVRNGSAADLARGRGMLYAEKAMIARKEQLTPTHTHKVKAEDIINRGGGTLVLELCGDADGSPDRDRPVTVRCDGIERRIAGGDKLKLSPGESVTLMPGDWHAFWAEGSDVFVGEVSTVNDDAGDNYFADPRVSRFSGLQEDVAPTRLLVSDYASFL